MPGNCAYCGTALKRRSNSPRGASLDHLIPRSALRKAPVTLTERQRYYNKVPCCVSCNGKKADMDPRVWIATVNDPRRRESLNNILEMLPVSLIYGETK